MKITAVSVSLLVVFSSAGPAPGVQPGGWLHGTEADFAKGEFDSTVVSSLGEVRLGRKIEILMPSDEGPAVVSAIAVTGRTVYAGSGVDGAIYRIAGGKAAKFAKVPGTMVCSLLWTREGLLVGTGGDKAGVYRVDPRGKVRPLWVDPEVKYVWAMVAGRGTIYAGTGPGGAVYAVRNDGKAARIYETGDLAKNILALALSAKSKNLLYAGTDDSGLVIAIDVQKKKGRVLLDADEKEISTLIPDAQGGLYVATADAAKASDDGTAPPSDKKTGKADNGKPEPEPGPGPEPEPRPKPETTQPAPKEEPDRQPDPRPDDKTEDQPQPKPATAPAVDAECDLPAKAPENVTPPKKETTDPPKRRVAALTPAPPKPAAPPAPDKRSGPTPEQVAKMIAAKRAAAAQAAKPAAPPAAKGNAVYYIQPDGLVRTLFRRPVTILSMIRQGDRLILGTGNGGDIYAVTPDGDEIAKLADTDAKQITALVGGAGGSIVFGSANRGSVGVVEKQLSPEGTHVSEALDAKQIAKWGTAQVRSALPAGTKVTVATRSGNVAKPDDRTWSDWSGEMPVEDFLRIASPAARFLQYRLTLHANEQAGPAVQRVAILYQVGNLAPSVFAVAVKASAQAPKQPARDEDPLLYRHVAVRAADVNGDKLSYEVELRQVGEEKWIRIAEDLDKPLYVWDTRTVADGVYELRVTASDALANPPETALTAARISEPVVVDNTAPTVRNLAVRAADGKVTVSGVASDAASRIAAIHYSVDSQSEWVTVLPSDGIADSPRERFSFQTGKLAPGPHRIAVRVQDLYRNTGYAARTVNAGK